MTTVYVDQANGIDAAGHGTINLPYQTLAYAIFSMPIAAIGETMHYQIQKGPEAQYDALTQSATKKAKKDTQGLEKKHLKAEAEENEACKWQEKCEMQLEESKKVVLAKDLSLLMPIKSNIARLVIYRDKQNKTYDAVTLQLEAAVELTGTLKLVPEGQKAPGGHELVVNYWKVLRPAPGGDDAFTNKLNEMQVEGSATLFKLDYYGQPAFLTQSSQLYLKTCLPSLGDVFCIQESFHAENSHMHCHLSEYIHLEAELAFVDFDDLIARKICELVDKVLANPTMVALVKMLNLNFIAPARPFKRMSYLEAIVWLNEHTILHEAEDTEGNTIKDADGKPIMVPHSIGDDVAEAAEWQMTDIIGKPIFLYAFPAELKAFYMKKMPSKEGEEAGPVFTESCDLPLPNVGEIVNTQSGSACCTQGGLGVPPPRDQVVHLGE
ncbi:asparaginyl-tRNA synthetase [Pisolithus sp. B1]|nr:asparaginyl-tRNA synthetase [Pisolithus sp. B1]